MSIRLSRPQRSVCPCMKSRTWAAATARFSAPPPVGPNALVTFHLLQMDAVSGEGHPAISRSDSTAHVRDVTCPHVQRGRTL